MCTSKLMHNLLSESNGIILEPVMQIEISTAKKYA